MDNKALLDEMTMHATILDHHIRRLKKNPGQLHEIDVDLMSEKLKKIYSLVHELIPGEIDVKNPEGEMLNPDLAEKETEPENEPDTEPESIIRQTDVMEHPVAETTSNPADPGPEEIPEVEVQGPDPTVTNDEPEMVPEPEPLSIEPQTETAEHFRSEPRTTDTEPPRTTADLFTGATTLADTLQPEKDNTIAATVSPQPVQDLKMAIGINDKFLFINELFNGDPALYNQSIEKLNTSDGLSGANAFLESCRGDYGWADNSEAYHRLKKIVKSKYNG